MPATSSSRARRAAALAAALAVVATAVASAAPSTSDLQQRIDSTQQHEQGVQGAIQRENSRIARYQDQIDDVNARLGALQQQLAIERDQLEQTERQLRDARGRLLRLQATLRSDRAALARQLVAQYESPPDDIVTVVLHAHGFTDLIERVDDMSRLRKSNERVTTRVGVARAAVAVQARRLATLAARRRRIANGTLVQRDEVARLRLAAVQRQLQIVRVRTRDRGQLSVLQQHEHSLQGTLQKIQAREAAANAVPTSGTLGGPGPGVTNTPFAAHGGSTGFFQAPGTNYAQGVEPIIAARLDRLGKALGLHLIGISGYRTPQHSIEVGGFADDPHTRGEASDTPGVEGVSEATLEQFGLTRPFGGAAEADHIQLLGSA
jgi:TolA-binding protein